MNYYEQRQFVVDTQEPRIRRVMELTSYEFGELIESSLLVFCPPPIKVLLHWLNKLPLETRLESWQLDSNLQPQVI